MVDFPRGEGTTAARVGEAAAAVRRAPAEIDVVPVPGVLAGRWGTCSTTCAPSSAGAGPVKVILETARLTGTGRSWPRRCRAAGAAFVKTSTGFGVGGATPEDVALLRAVVGTGSGVKASGGMRTAADALRCSAPGRAGSARASNVVGILIVATPRPVKTRMDCRRFVILVADSAGCGALPDAREYGDEGSDTIGNTSRAVGGLALPVLGRMGLGHLTASWACRRIPSPAAFHGRMAERSTARTRSPVTGR